MAASYREPVVLFPKLCKSTQPVLEKEVSKDNENYGRGYLINAAYSFHYKAISYVT